MVDALVIQTSISGNYLTNNLEIMYFMQKKCNSYDSEFKSFWNSLYFTYFTLIRKNQNNSENRITKWWMPQLLKTSISVIRRIFQILLILYEEEL